MLTVIQRGALLAFLCLSIAIESPSAPAQQDLPSAEAVRSRLDALPEAEDAALRVRLQRTLDALERLGQADSRRAIFAAESNEAPALLNAIKANPQTRKAPTDPSAEAAALTLDALLDQLGEAEAEQAAAQSVVNQLKDVTSRRNARQAELPGEIAAAGELVTSSSDSLSAANSEGADPDRRALLLALNEAAKAELAALQAERSNIEARRELLPLRRDQAAQRLAAAQKAKAAWQDSVGARRATEGDAAALQARADQADIEENFPALTPLMVRNGELAAMRTGEEGLPTRIKDAETLLDETLAALAETIKRSRSAQRRIQVGGITEGMGQSLRRDFEWMPKEADFKVQARGRAERLSRAQLQLIAIEEERAELADIAAVVDLRLAGINVVSPSEEVRAQATGILEARRVSLDTAYEELETLIATLGDEAQAALQREAVATEYRAFIGEKILWVPSSAANPMRSFLDIPEHARGIAVDLWQCNPIAALLGAAAKRPLFSLFIVLVALVLLGSRRILRAKREEMGARIRSYRTDRFVYTVRALAQTFLLALPIPLLMYGVGTLLAGANQTNNLITAMGGALRDTGWILLVLWSLQGVVSSKGIGLVHFKWPAESMAMVSRELRWATPIILSFGFVALTLDKQSNAAWSDSIGRPAFVVAMVTAAIVAHRILGAASPLWSTNDEKGEGLLSRTRGYWSIFASGLPAALAVLSLVGYYYTALQFELRIRSSVVLALSLILINALLLRWLYVTRRRLVVSQALELRAKRERKAEEALEGSAPAVDPATESGAASFDADKIDIPAVDAQTRQLFGSGITLATVLGLYLIWSSVLPALRGLDRVQLLPRPAIVDVQQAASSPTPVQATEIVDTDAPSEASAGAIPLPGVALPGAKSGATEGAPGAADATVKLPVLTLAQLALALIFLVLTSVAAKNLPALLELAVLQRIPMDHGARFAVSTIVRYVIMIFGVTAIAGALGIGWQHIQWLAAALTFGLAFGLQEIFANFVSGIIILIERPVRVGDIVTVGGTEGRVTQLRMRATTILDWDRREFLVPNKEFITGSVINWTLSDPVTRAVIRVGIAYGSDTALARRLLMRVAKRNKLVAGDPAPSAIFRKFGDSTLEFELRVYVENRDLFPQLIDEMHSEIDAEFRKAGIEIAFPQRDVHVRSSVVGTRRVDGDGSEPAT